MAKRAGQPATLIETLDRLTREVGFARGLVVAVRGLDCHCEGEREGVAVLAEAHVERLEAISAGLAEIIPQQARGDGDGPEGRERRASGAARPCRKRTPPRLASPPLGIEAREEFPTS